MNISTKLHAQKWHLLLSYCVARRSWLCTTTLSQNTRTWSRCATVLKLEWVSFLLGRDENIRRSPLELELSRSPNPTPASYSHDAQGIAHRYHDCVRRGRTCRKRVGRPHQHVHQLWQLRRGTRQVQLYVGRSSYYTTTLKGTLRPHPFAVVVSLSSAPSPLCLLTVYTAVTRLTSPLRHPLFHWCTLLYHASHTQAHRGWPSSLPTAPPKRRARRWPRVRRS